METEKVILENVNHHKETIVGAYLGGPVDWDVHFQSYLEGTGSNPLKQIFRDPFFFLLYSLFYLCGAYS